MEERQQDRVTLRQLRQQVLLHLRVRSVRVPAEDALQKLHQRHDYRRARRLVRVRVQQLHQQVAEILVREERLLVAPLQVLHAILRVRQHHHAQHLQHPEHDALHAALQRRLDQVHHALRLHEVVRQLRPQQQTVQRLKHGRRNLLRHRLVLQTGADLVIDRQVRVAQRLLLDAEQVARRRDIAVELAHGIVHLVRKGHLRSVLLRGADATGVDQRAHARVLHVVRVLLLRRVDLDARVRLHHLDHRLAVALHAADVQQRAQQRVTVAAAVATRRTHRELDEEHLRLVEAADQVRNLAQRDHRRDHKRLGVQLQQVVLRHLHHALHRSCVARRRLVHVEPSDHEIVVDELTLLLEVM